MSRIPRTVVLTTLAIVLAGCTTGGDGEAAPETGTSTTAVVGDPSVEYARCLRSKGFEVPDPDPGAGRDSPVGAVAVPTPRNEAEREALDECNRLLPSSGTQSDRGVRRDDAMRESLLAFAQCMRDHGIDYPDPKFLPNGGIDLSTPPDAGTAAFADAQAACRHLGGVEIHDGRIGINGRPSNG